MASEQLLRQSQVFAGLKEDEWDDLFQQASIREYQRGEYLAHAGDLWPFLFFLASGSIAAVKESSEGRALIATSLKQGDVFWGKAFFHPDLPMPVALKVDSPSRVYLWRREQLLPMLHRNGIVSWELSRLMVLHMLRASEIVEELAFQPVAGRLARLLLEQFADSSDDRLTRDLTLDEMAARIGSTREMVCRFLHRYADQGMITISRTEVSILDRPALSELAKQVK